jgi:hypothetical protein
MKKLLFLLAVAGLVSFAACKSGETKTEATEDSTAVTTEQAMPDSVPQADSVPAAE